MTFSDTNMLLGVRRPLRRCVLGLISILALVPGIGAAQAAKLAVTDADKAAAFKAAGFKRVGSAWKRCEEETPTASYQAGAIEQVVDLNADGRPEVVITESSLFCHGQSPVRSTGRTTASATPLG